MAIPALTAQIRALCDQIDAEASAPPERTCYFGYFGDHPGIIPEIADHADLAWPYGWPPPSNTNTDMKVAQEAKAAGMKIMLPVYGEGTQEAMVEFFNKCQTHDILDAVVALYPMDEPDVAGKSDAWVKEMVARTRRAAAKFPAIAYAPIAVIYGQKGTPGISAFNWIGRDDYGAGPQILPLQSGQRLMIVPGGASDWRESPDEFVAYAQAHPEVVAVVAFLWQWPDKPASEGIKSNGMADAYRRAGQTLTGRTGQFL